MPEIRGTLDSGPLAACVWCAEATSNRAVTPGRPDLGEVPLHVRCAGEIILAYRRLGEGKLLAAGAKKLVAFESRLNELDVYREARLPVPAQPVVAPINATEAEIRFALAFLDETVPTWRDQVRGLVPDEVRVAQGDFELRREIESRNRAFSGEDFAVVDPKPE